ncbi:MAG: DUF1887 family CARF protein [Victivallaceae bacterium]
MKKFNEHIILVSGQMIPNVTPIMDKRYRPKKVTLCVTDQMKGQGEILEKFFKKYQIATEIFPIGNALDYDSLLNRFEELADKRVDGAGEVAVNLTGGTKLMTLAASQILNLMYLFYVTGYNMILPVMPPKNSEKELPEELQTVMKLSDFFAIHGYKVTKSQRTINISEAEKKLFEYLFKDPKLHAEAIKIVNALAVQGTANNLCVHAENAIPDKVFELLELFQAAGKISYYDDRKVTFTDEAARRYCNGIWLEDYLYYQLTLLNKKIKLQDLAGSLEIEGVDGARNEIDAAFICNNTVYLVECKTANLQQDRAAPVLYKLDSIKGIPGNLTKGILVSYLSLDEYDKRRAGELRIQIFDCALAKDLADQLAAKLQKTIGI